MSVAEKPTSCDRVIEDAFGTPVAELHASAAAGTASPVVHRVMELRAFLGLAEEQVARVRDRMHQATAPERDISDLLADDLRLDVQWLQAALTAREEYALALGELLRVMPTHATRTERPVQFSQAKATAQSAPGGGLTVTSVHRPRRP